MIHHKLYRQHCDFEGGVYIKNLDKLGRQIKDIVILDNSSLSYKKHSKNGIPIRSWYSDTNDRDLINLIPILLNLSKFYDITTQIPKFISNDSLIFPKAYKWFNENRMRLDPKTDKHISNIIDNFITNPNKEVKIILNQTAYSDEYKGPSSMRTKLIYKLLASERNLSSDEMPTQSSPASLIKKSKKPIQVIHKEMFNEGVDMLSNAMILSETIQKSMNLNLSSNLKKKRKKQISDANSESLDIKNVAFKLNNSIHKDVITSKNQNHRAFEANEIRISLSSENIKIKSTKNPSMNPRGVQTRSQHKLLKNYKRTSSRIKSADPSVNTSLKFAMVYDQIK